MMNCISVALNTNIASQLAEDVGAPELRNPLCGGMRGHGWLRRLVEMLTRANH